MWDWKPEALHWVLYVQVEVSGRTECSRKNSGAISQNSSFEPDSGASRHINDLSSTTNHLPIQFQSDLSAHLDANTTHANDSRECKFSQRSKRRILAHKLWQAIISIDSARTNELERGIKILAADLKYWFFGHSCQNTGFREYWIWQWSKYWLAQKQGPSLWNLRYGWQPLFRQCSPLQRRYR